MLIPVAPQGENPMKLLKTLSVVSLALFSMAPASFVERQSLLTNPEASACQEQAMCGRCGDGYCAKQCGETAVSCPADCGTAL
jgi:hypothetical protein